MVSPLLLFTLTTPRQTVYFFHRLKPTKLHAGRSPKHSGSFVIPIMSEKGSDLEQRKLIAPNKSVENVLAPSLPFAVFVSFFSRQQFQPVYGFRTISSGVDSVSDTQLLFAEQRLALCQRSSRTNNSIVKGGSVPIG